MLIGFSADGVDFSRILDNVGFKGGKVAEQLIQEERGVSRDPISGDSRVDAHLVEAAF